jgi:hypothetical protein
MSLDQRQRQHNFAAWKAGRGDEEFAAQNDELLWNLWCSARTLAIDECINTVNARVHSLFAANRTYDSAEAMRCAGALRQLKLQQGARVALTCLLGALHS